MDAFANQWSFDMLTQSSAVALVRRFASVMSGRSLLAGVALLAACDLVIAQATDWPTRSVTVIVPFAAGGNTDIMARLASQKLADDFKQPFVVENRVGAGGAIAANYVAQAAPDGYTLFFAASPQIAVLPNVQKVNYDPIKDFTPVSVFGTGPFILAISAAIPAKTIPEFVSYAKVASSTTAREARDPSATFQERFLSRAQGWIPSTSRSAVVRPLCLRFLAVRSTCTSATRRTSSRMSKAARLASSASPPTSE